ncbi:hypothetical protein WDU94_002723 [Cyamophila willieti]
MSRKVESMEIKMEEMEQRGNANKLEIIGVPPKYDCVSYTEEIFKAFRVDHLANPADYTVEKVIKQGNKEEPKSLVVSLPDKSSRDKILEKIKSTKPVVNTHDICNMGNPVPVYINEMLSPYLKKLFFEAKKIKNDKKYSYLWIKNGQILLKKAEDSKVMRLQSMADLAKI